MDRRLLDAAVSGDAAQMKQLALDDTGVLLGTTPQGNTCLHIACFHGHELFCKDVLASNQSALLLTAINKDGETPLLTAVTRGYATLASVLLRCCCDGQLSEAILKQDKRGWNALHHAIWKGYRALALELIEAEPALSKAANERNESPLFMAALMNFEDVLNKLLEIPDSAHSGGFGFNALHAAVNNGNKVITKRVIETRPWLASQETETKYTPMHLAAQQDTIDVLTVLLEHDPSLGYVISSDGKPLLCVAAAMGHVGVARELLKQCPDAPYCDEKGSTCLHEAVLYRQAEFVKFVLGSQELQHLSNLADNKGETALHLAARYGMVFAFNLHQNIVVPVHDNDKALTAVADNASSDSSSEVEATALTSSSEGIMSMYERNVEAAMKYLDIQFADVASLIASLEDSSSEVETTASTSSSEGTPMDGRVLEAAISGDARLMKDLASQDPSVLHGTTQQGNSCLHIASIHGHLQFCKHVLALNQCLPLLEAINADGETPLLTAVARGRATLASVLLRFCCDQKLSETILKQDKRGFNALHHAILRGHRKLAVELIDAEPALSKDVTEHYESPVFIAVMRGYEDVLEKLLKILDSAHGGADGCNALHAAVTSGNAVMAKRVIEARPGLVREENEDELTPMHLAARENKINVLRVLLDHDPSLGYFTSTDGSPLLCIAAAKGNIGVARELLTHCPDPPYCDSTGKTCLHIALSSGQADFVGFVVCSTELQHLVNLPDRRGKTPLQLANKMMAAVDKQKGKKMAAGGEQKIQTMKTMVSVFQWYVSNLSIHTETFTSEMEQLLEAAACGHVAEMRHLYLHVPGVLDGTTPQGNTCLHIAASHDHEVFCKEVQVLKPSLLATVNSDGETPLLVAVASGRVSVASVLLRCCRDQKLSGTILKQDKGGRNALHHAIRNGHRDLALQLIEEEPALSHAVNQYGESPMFIAVMRNFEEVFDKLLEIPGSAHGGAMGFNALHAAVRNGNSGIVTKIMEKLPDLAREENIYGSGIPFGGTPLNMAAFSWEIEILRVLLKHDRSLGYRVSTNGVSPLSAAAIGGCVGAARELLKHCPDVIYTTNAHGATCLHTAVHCQQKEFVDFVLGLPQSGRLINMRDSKGNTALHHAVHKCNPKMVAALLLHPDIDVTVFNTKGTANLSLPGDHIKTLNWNEVCMRILKADPQDATNIFNIQKFAKDKVTDLSRKDIKSLTQTYTSNTSLVAILIATITFAAAFTLPGGYSTDAGNEGLPIMARKIAFKAFLISDTLAMCSSLAVAFICIVAKWEDLEFLLYYRAFTKKLMWFAYIATTTAFATGLYTVLAPQLPWLAIAICSFTSLLPILTKLLGEWPILRLRFLVNGPLFLLSLLVKGPHLRSGRAFRSELLDMA